MVESPSLEVLNNVLKWHLRKWLVVTTVVVAGVGFDDPKSLFQPQMFHGCVCWVWMRWTFTPAAPWVFLRINTNLINTRPNNIHDFIHIQHIFHVSFTVQICSVHICGILKSYPIYPNILRQYFHSSCGKQGHTIIQWGTEQKETGHLSFRGVWTWINLANLMILPKLGIWCLLQRWIGGCTSWFIQRSVFLHFDSREILIQREEFRWDWSDSWGVIFHKFYHFS